jgi:probable HAF family extracellular repeat protein
MNARSRLPICFLLPTFLLTGCTDAAEPTAVPALSVEIVTAASVLEVHHKEIPLGSLGGGETEARALNARGQVVGTSRTVDGFFHAFFWDPRSGMLDLGAHPEETWSEAFDLNEKGTVVGTSYFGFVWSQRTGISWFGCRNNTLALGVNNAGTVVGIGEELLPGWIVTMSGATPYAAFTYRNGICAPIMDSDFVATRAWAVSERGEVTGLGAHYTVDPARPLDLLLTEEEMPFVWSPHRGFLLGVTREEDRTRNPRGDFVSGGSLFTRAVGKGGEAEAPAVSLLVPGARPTGLSDALAAEGCPPIEVLVREPGTRLARCMERVRGMRPPR